ncbi:hypothetical protein LDO51_12595 [Providencia alcalifaciens]|uniref:hypothetical protein n=1 Tax=Providencia alcalifaciens TaxID=126385 RepID=UPI001CE060E5|nr:hypothetical protein [Providencia alcalifaciens]UBX48000.1 hypothetical protein LDO51_12595 [Providencia alcalifaciens]
MNTINNTPSVQIRRMSVTDQQGKTTEFSRSTKSVNNNSTPMPKSILKTASSTSDTSSPKKAKHVRIITTEQKTVHMKDITGLKKEINTGIKEIRDSIKAIMSNNIRWDSPKILRNINSQFCKLQEKVDEYQDKLTTSGYEHNKSKQASINKLNDKIDAIKPSIAEAKGRAGYINQMINEANSPNGVKGNLEKMTEKNQALQDRIDSGY